jgi:hypothetical protein
MDINKPYTIELEDRGEYLYVLVGGRKLTVEIAVSYWTEIAGACLELEKSKILIEKDFAESVSPVEMIQMSDFLGEVLPNKKIAFLDRYGNESINELGKKLARNRNVKLQLFTNIKEAEEWLFVN